MFMLVFSFYFLRSYYILSSFSVNMVLRIVMRLLIFELIINVKNSFNETKTISQIRILEHKYDMKKNNNESNLFYLFHYLEMKQLLLDAWPFGNTRCYKLKCVEVVMENVSELLIGTSCFNSNRVQYIHLCANAHDKGKNLPLQTQLCVDL